MSAVAELHDAADERIDWLAQHIAANRFLPVPPAESIFVGDGDFLAIGAEFLKHFVRVGGLRPEDRVLDIGCGIGRMAVPLTQYLAPTATYDGFDIVESGISWCSQAITAKYPNFRFRHLDLAHPIYNPGGRRATEEASLPYNDGTFDFIFMVSVLTHLRTEEMRAYAREAARLLAPGGRCFVTAFMMNGAARQALGEGKGRLSFDAEAPGPEFLADPENPCAAVAYEEDFLLAAFLKAGLRRRRPAVYGHWSGRNLPSFQDISVFEWDDQKR